MSLQLEVSGLTRSRLRHRTLRGARIATSMIGKLGFYFVPGNLEDTVVRRAQSDGA
jgi:hypothetical protein